MRRGRHRNAVTTRLDRTLAGAALFRHGEEVSTLLGETLALCVLPAAGATGQY